MIILTGAQEGAIARTHGPRVARWVSQAVAYLTSRGVASPKTGPKAAEYLTQKGIMVSIEGDTITVSRQVTV